MSVSASDHPALVVDESGKLTDEQERVLEAKLKEVGDKYDLDIKQIVLDKLRRNAEKYHVDKAYGSAKKYNEL